MVGEASYGEARLKTELQVARPEVVMRIWYGHVREEDCIRTPDIVAFVL